MKNGDTSRNLSRQHQWLAWLAVSVSLLSSSAARADAVTDWNTKAGDIVVAGTGVPSPANRILAIVQTAVFDATNAITQRYPAGAVTLDASPAASVESAIAAANRATLTQLLPAQQAAIEVAYQAALARVADGPAKAAGIAVGEKAAAQCLALRANDGAATTETYRPYTATGVYVPTAIPTSSQWMRRKPWLMSTASEFRPGPPPKPTSEVWARDFNEVKMLGAKNSTQRTPEQTDIARFWEATMPPIYHGVVRSVANQPGREVTQNARLFAAVTQAVDDANIAVFDAKYHYNFWRPITAIRNGDTDGNDATEREASWTPYIVTPMHPEYPCAHCIVSGAVGTVLQTDIGAGPQPTLATHSVTANGAARSWATTAAFMQEVANARIYDGVHFRHSTEVGTAMGKQIGALAVVKYFPTRKEP